MENFNLTPVIELAVVVLFAVITGVLVPWLRSKTNAAQQKALADWVNIAVYAAEQLYRGSGRGEEKKEYVVEFLKSKGLYVDAEKIEALIESEVARLNSTLPISFDASADTAVS